MTTAQQKPLTISISEEAADHVRDFAEQAGKPGTNVRVGVKGGGCSGLTYVLDLVDGPAEDDKIIRDHGLELYIDRKLSELSFGAVFRSI